MKAVDVEALRKLEAEATKGEWKLWGMSVMADTRGDSNFVHATKVCDTHYTDANGHPRTNDAYLIATVRNALPDLLALIEAQTEALLEDEWGAGNGSTAALAHCRTCGGCRFDPSIKHAFHIGECSRDALLTAAGLATQELRDAKRAEIAKRKETK